MHDEPGDSGTKEDGVRFVGVSYNRRGGEVVVAADEIGSYRGKWRQFPLRKPEKAVTCSSASFLTTSLTSASSTAMDEFKSRLPDVQYLQDHITEAHTNESLQFSITLPRRKL